MSRILPTGTRMYPSFKRAFTFRDFESQIDLMGFKVAVSLCNSLIQAYMVVRCQPSASFTWISLQHLQPESQLSGKHPQNSTHMFPNAKGLLPCSWLQQKVRTMVRSWNVVTWCDLTIYTLESWSLMLQLDTSSDTVTESPQFRSGEIQYCRSVRTFGWACSVVAFGQLSDTFPNLF